MTLAKLLKTKLLTPIILLKQITSFDVEFIKDLNRYPDSITRLFAFVRSPETKDNLV
jgi:hypothetical protein